MRHDLALLSRTRDVELPCCRRRSRGCSVLHVGKFYPPHMGGIETHLQALCGELRRPLDLRVIVSSEDRKRWKRRWTACRVSRLPTRLTFASTSISARAWSPAFAARARRHGPHPSAQSHRGSGLSRERPSRALVVTYHSDTVRQKVSGPLFEPFLHAGSAPQRGDHRHLARLSAHLSRSARFRDRCHVIPYGIAARQFEQCRSGRGSGTSAQRYGERLVISVGRLVYYKGFEYLIRAMRQVRGKLVIVGDGPLRENCEALAARSGRGR